MAKRKRSEEPNGDKPLPGCKAILLCEKIIVDTTTKQVTLVGLIKDLALPAFPRTVPQISLYVQLVDGIGAYELAIEVHDLMDGSVVMRAEGIPVDFLARRQRFNLCFNISSLSLGHAGEYDVVVFAMDREIDRQRFSVIPPHPEENGSNEEEP